ncbi:unnamed protein product [Cuscuta campestris]|uniref:BTB domain-containing protein n=1 Tax=Cuscuta campestris TaxID=132261 RepID=A0A484NQ16_9ASTE|nr:unnamed protein product [Cuscuta campestris]
MASDNKLKNNQSLVSTMIRQGFISDPFLSSPPPPSKLAAALSPPPSNQSPTLFEMISKEHSRSFRHSPDSLHRAHDRISRVLARAPFQTPIAANCRYGPADVNLTIAARDGGPRVSMDVHRRVLVSRSRFFAENLRSDGSHSVEILDCDDAEVYVEAVVLMYCDDLKKKLIGEGVPKVLGLLKVSSAIAFDDGIMACLEYLEAAPWSPEEEEKVATLFSELHLSDSEATDVLQRIVSEPSTSPRPDEIFLKLFSGVLQAKDEKARREMKTAMSGLLSDESTDISPEILHHICRECLDSLLVCAYEALGVDESNKDRGAIMGAVAREADNVHWVVGILIDRKIGDEFVHLWADQKELAALHPKIPTMYRHDISRITSQLCVAIGRGSVLVPKGTRYALLATWLEALYEDFGWMSRAGRLTDKNVVEDGLSQTVLTLPLPQQQEIMLRWFQRFLDKGDDCPNIHKAFQVWWRRAFIRRDLVGDSNRHLQLALCDYPLSTPE